MTQFNYYELITQLMELAGEIGTRGESNEVMAEIYDKLSEALDVAENNNLLLSVED